MTDRVPQSDLPSDHTAEHTEHAEHTERAAAPSVAPSAAPVDGLEAAGSSSCRESAPSWPFTAYLVVWIGFAVLVVWRFAGVPRDIALFDIDSYRSMIIAGLTLTATGPVLSIAVWLAVAFRPSTSKGAVFASALFKGAVTTFAGVLAWWVAMLVLDQLRYGSLL